MALNLLQEILYKIMKECCLIINKCKLSFMFVSLKHYYLGINP